MNNESIPRLSLLVLRSDNAEKLKEFYQSLLTIEFEYHQHGTGPFHYSSYVNGVIFEIYNSSKNYKQNDSLRLGFAVSKLDTLITRLVNDNFEILSYPTKKKWGYQSIILDTDGRKIELTED